MIKMKNVVMAATLASFVAVTGCTEDVTKWSSEERASPATVELVSHQIKLPLAHHQPIKGSKTELGGFLKNIGADRNAEIWVLSPDVRSADTVVALLEDLGIEPGQIRLTPFGAHDTPSVVTVRVDQFLLILAECKDWANGNLINTSNRSSSNWGCSVDRNLALTLVNPRDLIRGRPLGRASAQNAVDAVRRYYSGNTKPLPKSSTSNFLKN